MKKSKTIENEREDQCAVVVLTAGPVVFEGVGRAVAADEDVVAAIVVPALIFGG